MNKSYRRSIIHYYAFVMINSFRHVSIVKMFFILTDLPEYFDSRKSWPHCTTIPVIQDQSSCGSCWAVATASVISDRMCTYKNLRKNIQISAANLMNCCKNCSSSAGSCDGGDPLKALQHWKDKGLVSGGEFGSYGTCDPYPIPPRSLQDEASKLEFRKNKTNKYIRMIGTCKNYLLSYSYYIFLFLLTA